MTNSPTESTIRSEVTVPLSADRAFEVFTEHFDRIKPREHSMLAVPSVGAVFETHVGGHVYDQGKDGSISKWARPTARPNRTGDPRPFSLIRRFRAILEVTSTPTS